MRETPVKESDMKTIHINSKMLLRSMVRRVVEYLELANQIPEEDFRKIVVFSQKQKKYLKNINDNVERGNLFMMLFFIRELIESILNEDT
jgi:hypothetical protein